MKPFQGASIEQNTGVPMNAVRFAIASIVLGLSFAGCGGKNALKEVSGEVVYNGQPVQKGTISFLPADGNGPSAAGIIADGRYKMKVAPGKKKVNIEAFKTIGRRHDRPNDPNSPMVDVEEQYLPDRYNANTSLTREITSDMRVCDLTLDK
jgi:hypothetical protein